MTEGPAPALRVLRARVTLEGTPVEAAVVSGAVERGLARAVADLGGRPAERLGAPEPASRQSRVGTVLADAVSRAVGDAMRTRSPR